MITRISARLLPSDLCPELEFPSPLSSSDLIFRYLTDPSFYDWTLLGLRIWFKQLKIGNIYNLTHFLRVMNPEVAWLCAFGSGYLMALKPWLGCTLRGLKAWPKEGPLRAHSHGCWKASVLCRLLCWGSHFLTGCWLEASLSPLPCGPLHRAAYNMAASFLRSDKSSLLPYAIGHADLVLVERGRGLHKGMNTRRWGSHWEPSWRLAATGRIGAFCMWWKIAVLRTSRLAGAQSRWPLVYLGMIFSLHFFIDVLEF